MNLEAEVSLKSTGNFAGKFSVLRLVEKISSQNVFISVLKEKCSFLTSRRSVFGALFFYSLVKCFEFTVP